MPDFTQPSASSAVFSLSLYSISHDIAIRSAPLACPQGALAQPPGSVFLITHSGIVNCPIEKHFQHLKQFQLPHDLNGPIHDGFTLQKVPQIFFGKNKCLDHLAERDSLVSAATANLAVAVLYVQFVLVQQPFTEVTIDFVDTLSK